MLRFEPAASNTLESELARQISLPEDLPPGKRLHVAIPTDRLPYGWSKTPLQVVPMVAGVGKSEVSPEQADLKLSIDPQATEVARNPSKAAVPQR